MRKSILTTLLACLLCMAFGQVALAQTKVQRGVARMITRSVTDPIVPVAGVQVVVGNAASKTSDGNGRFSLNVSLNNEQSYQLADVRVPKGSKLVLASPSKKKKLFWDKNQLEVALISQDEKNMVSRANYKTLLKKYNEQAEQVRKLREQLEARQAELDENSEEYRIVTAKRDSVQALLNLYFDDKIYEQTLKDIERIAEDLALTDYQSLDSIEARIYELKMQGDWGTISDLLVRLMGGNASAWLHEKLDRRNEAAKDFAMGMEMIKEAIEAFKMQHLNDSVSYYYDILVKADSTNWEILNAAGMFEERNAQYEKSMHYHSRALSLSNVDTLKAITLNNMGNIYAAKSEYVHAFDCYNEALDIWEDSQNKNSSLYKAKLYVCIGTVYVQQGFYNRALDEFFKALPIYQSEYGEYTNAVSTIYNNIGLAYCKQDDMNVALNYYEKSLEINKMNSDSLALSANYMNIGEIYNNQGKFSIALDFVERTKGILERNLRKNHPLIASVYNSIGYIYLMSGQDSLAQENFRGALGIYKLNGESYWGAEIATCYDNIGTFYQKMHDYAKSYEFHNKALEKRKTILPENHTDIATSYSNLGSDYLSTGRYDLAMEEYSKALEISRLQLGELSPNVATLYNNIGAICQAAADYTDALRFFEIALYIYKEAYGENNYHVGMSYGNMGSVYYYQANYPQAIDALQKAYDIMKNIYGEEHASSKAIQAFLNKVKQAGE